MAQDQEGVVTACVVIIGNEILSGRTKDANLSYLAAQLDERGVRLKEARVVADDPQDIVETLNEVRAKYDYVFTTGGIGPTHDDITAECVAEAFGVPLIQNPEARAMLDCKLLQKLNLHIGKCATNLCQIFSLQTDLCLVAKYKQICN